MLIFRALVYPSITARRTVKASKVRVGNVFKSCSFHIHTWCHYETYYRVSPAIPHSQIFPLLQHGGNRTQIKLVNSKIWRSKPGSQCVHVNKQWSLPFNKERKRKEQNKTDKWYPRYFWQTTAMSWIKAALWAGTKLTSIILLPFRLPSTITAATGISWIFFQGSWTTPQLLNSYRSLSKLSQYLNK